MNREIITKQDELIPSDNCNEKILSINRDTPQVDFRGVLLNFIHCADFSNAINTLEKTKQYVVSIPIQYQVAFDKHILQLNQNSKNGSIWPTLVRKLPNGKREFVANLPVSKESASLGNPIYALSSNLQNIILQQELEELTHMAQDIYDVVIRVEQGQMDDRIGLLKSGYEGIELALLHSGEQKERELEYAREQIREAKSRIGEQLNSRLNFFEEISPHLVFRLYKLYCDKYYDEKKNNEYSHIQQLFDIYIFAVHLLGFSYSLVQDVEAVKKVFDNADTFIINLNFRKLSTIKYIHKNAPDNSFIFNTASKTLSDARTKCLEIVNPYTHMELSFSGNEILEVYKDGIE